MIDELMAQKAEIERKIAEAKTEARKQAIDAVKALMTATGVTLTPRHYSYLKISEGCNHKCKFCIIPDMRGLLPALAGYESPVRLGHLLRSSRQSALCVSSTLRYELAKGRGLVTVKRI